MVPCPVIFKISPYSPLFPPTPICADRPASTVKPYRERLLITCSAWRGGRIVTVFYAMTALCSGAEPVRDSPKQTEKVCRGAPAFR